MAAGTPKDPVRCWPFAPHWALFVFSRLYDCCSLFLTLFLSLHFCWSSIVCLSYFILLSCYLLRRELLDQLATFLVLSFAREHGWPRERPSSPRASSYTMSSLIPSEHLGIARFSARGRHWGRRCRRRVAPCQRPWSAANRGANRWPSAIDPWTVSPSVVSQGVIFAGGFLKKKNLGRLCPPERICWKRLNVGEWAPCARSARGLDSVFA